MKKIIPTLFILGFFVISACQTMESFTQNIPGARDYISKKTYAAAESLASQAELTGLVSKNTPIVVGTFSDINNVETSSALGRVVSEQLTTRLVQLGYNVTEVKLRDHMAMKEDGEFVLSRNPEDVNKVHSAAAIISGTFSKGDDLVLFNTRMVGAANSRLIAAEDFTLPYRDDVKTLMRTNVAKDGKWYNHGNIVE